MKRLQRILTIRVLGTLALTASLVFMTTGFKACKNTSREQMISYAEDIADAVKRAQPVVQSLNPKAGAVLAQAIPIADKVIAAVKDSDATQAVEYLNDLLPIINATVAQFSNNPTVLGIMALADIGIHFLIKHIPRQALTNRAAGVSADHVADYAAKPAWGCQYHPDKCKGL